MMRRIKHSVLWMRNYASLKKITRRWTPSLTIVKKNTLIVAELRHSTMETVLNYLSSLQSAAWQPKINPPACQSREMKRKLVNHWKRTAPKLYFDGKEKNARRWMSRHDSIKLENASKLQFIMRVGSFVWFDRCTASSWCCEFKFVLAAIGFRNGDNFIFHSA